MSTHPGYAAVLRALYGEPKRGFQRERVPDPLTYYRAHLHTLRIGRDGWARARCPFHEDNHASLSVNLNHGGWRCHAGCGSGDLVRFHQCLTGLEFADAARDLGAWNDAT